MDNEFFTLHKKDTISPEDTILDNYFKDEYVINEGEDINISFSLSHLSKMCTSMKLSSTINVALSLSNPMLLKYNLGDDSYVSFFIAPKISDNE